MKNILVLGGGVGGTLVANLISRKIKKQIDAGEARVTVVDETGEHVYQPGFMYIAMGDQDPESLRKPERRLLDDRVELVVGTLTAIDEAASQVAPGRRHARLDYDELVLATGSRILPETIEHFEQEAHHFYSEEAAQRLRKALDAFSGGKVVVGIASMPYKCPPAPLEVAFLIEAELRERGLRDQSELHYCSPIGAGLHHRVGQRDGDSGAREEGHRAAHVLQRGGHRPRAQDRPAASRARSWPTTCSSSCRRTRAPRCSSTAAWRRRRAAGCRPTRRRSTSRAARTSGPSATPPTCRLSKAGLHRPLRGARHRRARGGARPGRASRTPRRAVYTGKVMCFFEVGDGKGTLLRFDYEHPPTPPTPSRLWHLGKIVFNKTLLPHRAARPRRHASRSASSAPGRERALAAWAGPRCRDRSVRRRRPGDGQPRRRRPAAAQPAARRAAVTGTARRRPTDRAPGARRPRASATMTPRISRQRS